MHDQRSISILLMFCLLLTGCAAAPENAPAAVTDEETQAKLWEEYLAEAYGTIGNEDFAAPEDVQDLGPFLYYVLERMAAEGELSVTAGQIVLPPLSVMQAKLDRYFNTDFDLTAETYAAIYDYHAGDPAQGTLYFSPHSVSYPESLMDDHRLGEVTFDEAAQTYQAAVVHIANPDTVRIDLIHAFTLKQRDNGELYFVSQERQYPPLPEGLVTFTGSLAELPGLQAGLEELSLGAYPEYTAGPWQGELLMLISTFTEQTPYRDIYLLMYSPAEDRVLAKYAFTETAQHIYSGLRLMDDRLLLRFTDGYLYLDDTLSPASALKPLPETVRSAVNDHHEWSGCYDVSDDENTFYYLRESKELWQYDVQSHITQPLFRRAALDFSGNYGLFDLQLLPNEQTLIMTLAGYGGPIGQYALSLDAPSAGRQYRTHYEPLQNWSNAGCPLPDVDYSTLLDGGAYEWSLLSVTDDADISFTVPVTEEQQFRDVSRGDYLLYNDRYAVYTTALASGRYPEDTIYYLIRVDLKTHTAQTLISSQAAYLQPVAILDDGRVLFRYSFEQLHRWALTP